MEKGWVVITVETGIDWPSSETTVEFEGRQLILRPSDADCAPDVRMRFETEAGSVDAYETICRFLSALTWWNRRRARAIFCFTGSTPRRGGRGPIGPPVWNGFYLEDGVAVPPDPNARLAIALYREAVSIENTAYEFLGYFKIINIIHRSGKDQIAWINNTIGQLTEQEAVARLRELSLQQSDIGEYLYASGRCAVAHAFGTPVVDPDDPRDVLRLSADMPVIRALAEHIISVHFGVRNRYSGAKSAR